MNKYIPEANYPFIDSLVTVISSLPCIDNVKELDEKYNSVVDLQRSLKKLKITHLKDYINNLKIHITERRKDISSGNFCVMKGNTLERYGNYLNITDNDELIKLGRDHMKKWMTVPGLIKAS